MEKATMEEAETETRMAEKGTSSSTARRVVPATVPIECIDDARRGSQRAFDAIFRTYQPGLLRYLRTVSPDLSADIAGATWESVASSLGRFQGDGADFRRWLFTIARRRLVDEVRRSSRRQLRIAEAENVPGVDAELDQPDWAAQVLRQIPTRQADVVGLRVIGGLSVEETARLLGISRENVRVLSHRGLNAIRRILSDADLAELDNQEFSVVV